MDYQHISILQSYIAISKNISNNFCLDKDCKVKLLNPLLKVTISILSAGK